jgi:UDP-N-acetylmuramoylalanine--D-glutamate ligase
MEGARNSPSAESGRNIAVKAYLGGNITVSPLAFLDDLRPGDDVVLELSSWQLRDLRARLGENGLPLLKPRAAVLTAIMSDHMNYYANMDAYVADKRVIYWGQDEKDIMVACNDQWGKSFHAESRARPLAYSDAPLDESATGGWLAGPRESGFARFYDNPPPGLGPGEIAELVPASVMVPGFHQKRNLLTAGLACLSLGLDIGVVRERLGAFAGIEHRLEFFHKSKGVSYYNDSAATIPEAAAAALDALSQDAPVVLVTGGTDKNLDFSPLVRAAVQAKAVILLDGTGGNKLACLFDERGIAYRGPFDSVEKAVRAAAEKAGAGDRVVLSPGCASFGMFLNEFDRGRKWKEAVLSFA